VNNAKAVVGLCMLLLSIGLGWLLLGWWMLAIVMIGLVWHFISANKARPSTSHYKPPENPPSCPTPTGPTWQETVARIEAARQLEAPEVPSESEPTSSPRGVQDTRPWQVRVEEIERSRTTQASPLTDHLPRIAQRAHIAAGPLLSMADEISAAAASGSTQELDQVLRTCCPPDAWDWPEAKVLLQQQGKRGTRLQQVDLVVSMVLRAHTWAGRLPHMRMGADRRPYWQFRAVGDSRDPPACKALSGRVERYDSQFWNEHGPWVCNEPLCRCTVRTYTERDWQQSQAT
jgi:hypothetical protein